EVTGRRQLAVTRHGWRLPLLLAPEDHPLIGACIAQFWRRRDKSIRAISSATSWLATWPSTTPATWLSTAGAERVADARRAVRVAEEVAREGVVRARRLDGHLHGDRRRGHVPLDAEDLVVVLLCGLAARLEQAPEAPRTLA